MTTLTTFPSITVNKYGLKKFNYEYFLIFSSKEEYLEKRKEWREIYDLLSKELRNNKQVHKWVSRRYSSPKKPFVFPDPFPIYQREFSGLICPTKMLNIRHGMKELSAKQRQDSFKLIKQ